MDQREAEIRKMKDRVYLNLTVGEMALIDRALHRQRLPISMLDEALRKELKAKGVPGIGEVEAYEEIYYDEEMIPYDSTIIPILFGHYKKLPHYLLIYRDTATRPLEKGNHLIIDVYRVSNGFVSMVDNDPPEEMTKICEICWDDMRLTGVMESIAKRIGEDYFYKVYPKLDYKFRYSNHSDTLISFSNLSKKCYEMHEEDWLTEYEDGVVRKKHRNLENDIAKIINKLAALPPYDWNNDPYWIARRDGDVDEAAEHKAKDTVAKQFADIFVELHDHIAGNGIHDYVAECLIDKIAANPGAEETLGPVAENNL